jgi:hypothetical protein
MTDKATPNRRPTYSRPTKYPAALPRTMTTTDQREYVDGVKDRAGAGATLGEAMRALLADGIALDVAMQRGDDLRADVERMARKAGVSAGEAIGAMLRFAVDESRRRMERNARIAVGVADGLAEIGYQVDGVSVGPVEISADH